MSSLITYLNCGWLEELPKIHMNSILTVSKFSEIRDKIIPFFDQFPLHGAKRLDYLDFCKIANLMEGKLHLTEEGLDQIRQIKDGMNTGR